MNRPPAPSPVRKPVHCIVLPNGKRCTVAAYVSAWKALKTKDPMQPVRGFYHFPERAGDVLDAIRRGVHDRINRHDRSNAGARRRDPAYELGLRRDARAIEDKLVRRVRLYRLETPELRERFAHLISDRNDY
jgi:hypothetical protein